MCDLLTDADELGFGRLHRLCAERADCILGEPILGIVRPGVADSQTERSPRAIESIASVVSTFCSSATYLVVEYSYFDLDYRSEFSKTHEIAFRDRSPDAVRLHFFDREQVHADVFEGMRDFVLRSKDTYLGYMVVRPQVPGLVGRSIVTVRTGNEMLAAGTTMEPHIRTAVTEVVQLFGVPLSARGVAFMEQDGYLLRCAHVSAWICHYSAVLRGLASRRATARFHTAGDTRQPHGRSYPSQGLSASALSAVLLEVDLPPEVVDIRNLNVSRPLSWSDSQEFIDRIEQATPEEKPTGDAALIRSEEDQKTKANLLKQLWIRENLTSTVCRYLNSGIPCILTRRAKEHTQVIVGYVRKRDLAGYDPASPTSHSELHAFIVSDDAKGPFVFVEVDEIAAEVAGSRNGMASIVIPLPRELLLSGEVAEITAREIFGRIAALAFANFSDLSGVIGDTNLDALKRFVSNTEQAGSNALTIRTYAMLGSEFKESISRRVTRSEMKPMVTAVCMSQLPKYVWVSEAIDRSLRHTNEPDVIATLVLDASDASVDNRSRPLFIHIPALACANFESQQFPDGGDANAVTWDVVGLDRYHSGRYGQMVKDSLEAVQGRFKTAGASH